MITAALVTEYAPIDRSPRIPASEPIRTIDPARRPSRIALIAAWAANSVPLTLVDQIDSQSSAVVSASGDRLRLEVRSRRLAYQLRLLVPGFAPSDDAFSVEPGGRRTVALLPLEAGALFRGGGISALNLDGTLAVRWEGPPP